MTPGTGTRHGTNSGIGGTGTRPGIGIWNGTRTWIPGSQSASTVDSIPFPQVDLYDVTTSPENKVRWRRHSSGGSDEEEEEEEGEEGGEEEGGERGRREGEDKFDENLVLNISSTASISTNTTSSSVYGSMLHR
jgi:hypothetical protein